MGPLPGLKHGDRYSVKVTSFEEYTDSKGPYREDACEWEHFYSFNYVHAGQVHFSNGGFMSPYSYTETQEFVGAMTPLGDGTWAGTEVLEVPPRGCISAGRLYRTVIWKYLGETRY